MRRGRSKEKRSVVAYRQSNYQQLRNPYPPMKIFSDDQIESIHLSSLKVLQQTGIDFQSERAVEINACLLKNLERR